MPERMDDKALVAIIKANRADSLGVDDGDLSNERAKALDRYHGRPMGNEVEGRSQVVSRDLAEAIDSIMPDIMRVFVSSGNIAEFVPVGPEDEEGAQQESDYTNQVIMQDNNGWMVLYDACKDALLLKNGYVKHCWVKDESVKDEDYEGVSLEDLTKIVTDLQAAGAEIKVKAQEEINGLFNVKLQITNNTGKCIIEAVPAEEVRVSRRCRGSLQDAPFVEHVTRKTRSQLIEMGMPKDFVDKIPADNSGNPDQVSNARDAFSEETEGGQAYADRSMDEVEFSEAYLKVDYDGDGVAELRKVVTCGNQIPPGEEWNEVIPSVPITSFVVKRMPHRHVGESIDDDLADIMEIKTALQRQLLDNVFRTNNNEIVVNERANIADFLVSLPGGIKRIEGTDPVQGAMQPLITSPIINSILPVIGYYDETKESRTGVSRATTGLDPDTLRESTKGAYLANLNRASQKIEMLTRMLAETGVKELVQQVHGLLLRYQDKARIVKLRGQYVSVNPREWKERNDIIVKVGIGTGNEQEKREKLMIAVGVQEKMAAANLVGPQHAYNMFTDVMKNLGFELASKYAFDPNSPEYQQFLQSQSKEQPNPIAEAEQVKGQFVLEKAKIDQQAQAQNEAIKAQANAQQAAIDAGLRRDEMTIKANLELEKTAATLAVERVLGMAKLELEALQLQTQQVGEIAPEGPGIADIIAQLGMQTQAIIDTLSRQKTIVRGPDGRVVGLA